MASIVKVKVISDDAMEIQTNTYWIPKGINLNYPENTKLDNINRIVRIKFFDTISGKWKEIFARDVGKKDKQDLSIQEFLSFEKGQFEEEEEGEDEEEQDNSGNRKQSSSIVCKRYQLEFDTLFSLNNQNATTPISISLKCEKLPKELESHDFDNVKESIQQQMENQIFISNGKCNCCFDYTNVHQLICGHLMCKQCLTLLFEKAMNDVSLLPVKCCKIVVPPKLASVVLSDKNFNKFHQKLTEESCKNKMYCPNKKCSQFIDLDLVDSTTVTKLICPNHDCSTQMCTKCKSPWHERLSCEEYQKKKETSIEDLLFQNLMKKEKWSKWNQCGHVILLTKGCNHMKCVCGYEFCYVCREKWKTCKCPAWNEENLLNVATRRQMNVEVLRQNHVCRHQNWEYVNHFYKRCENCPFTMKHYGYRCRRCRITVCYTCRHHRIVV